MGSVSPVLSLLHSQLYTSWPAGFYDYSKEVYSLAPCQLAPYPPYSGGKEPYVTISSQRLDRASLLYDAILCLFIHSTLSVFPLCPVNFALLNCVASTQILTSWPLYPGILCPGGIQPPCAETRLCSRKNA